MEIIDIDLMTYADGGLDADAARAVEAAVTVNPEARAKVEMFRQTSGLLKAACAETFYSTGLDHLHIPVHGPRRPSRGGAQPSPRRAWLPA